MGAKKNIKVLAWFNFFTDFKLYAAIAIIYFTQITHSFALGMSIFSVVNIADAVFEVPTGILSDLVGRRNIIILGAFSAVAYSIFFAIGGSYWMLFIGAVFQGLSIAFYSGNNDALLHDSLKESNQEHKFHEYLGKLSSLFQAALAISALLGSILASTSFTVVMWLSVLAQLICLALSFQITEPKIHIEKSTNIYIHMKEAVKLFFTNKRLGFVSIASTWGSAIGEAAFQFQSAFYNTLWPLWAIGFAKMLSYIGATFSFYFSGKIINKFNEIRSLLVGSIYNKIINIIAIIFPSVLSPVLMSSTALTYGVSTVSKNSLLQKEFTPYQRATIASLNSLLESIMTAVFAILIGLVGDSFGPAKALFLSQIISLVAVYMYWVVFRDEKSREYKSYNN